MDLIATLSNLLRSHSAEEINRILNMLYDGDVPLHITNPPLNETERKVLEAAMRLRVGLHLHRFQMKDGVLHIIVVAQARHQQEEVMANLPPMLQGGVWTPTRIMTDGGFLYEGPTYANVPAREYMLLPVQQRALYRALCGV